MPLTAEKGLWVANYPYEQRHIPKEAGFWWHGGDCRSYCRACKAGLRLKVWWTFKPEVAARLADDADESARELLGVHLNAVEHSKATDAEIDVPKPDGLEYLPYQRAGIAYALNRESTLIADEMGLGKTIESIGVVNALPETKSVLVICPASLRLNWLIEAKKWAVRDFAFHVVEQGTERIKTGEKVEKIVRHRDGTTSIKVVDETIARPITIPEDANFVIINYDLIRGKMVDTGRTDPKTKKPIKQFQPTPILAQVLAREWDVLIVDECHRVKSTKTLQSKALLGEKADRRKGTEAIAGIISVAKRKMFLTGTPILNRPVEIQPIAGALAPYEFGNFFAFAKRYCDAHQVKIGYDRWTQRDKMAWDFSGASNLEELQERLRGTIMIRRLKRDVLKELPAKRRQVIVLPANGASAAVKKEQKAWAQHEEQLEMIRAAIDFAHASGDKDAYRAAIRELRVASVAAFNEISAERKAVAVAKLPKVIEHLENAFEEGTEKIIFFGHHHEVCNTVVAHFGKAAVRLTGEDSAANRQAAVERFQTDPTCKLFVGSIGAAGVGITLTAASTVIFGELDWVPANLTQAEDRAHRLGQENPVLIQHLVVDGSLDAHMAQMAVDKQEIADRALDRNTGIEVPVTPKTERRPSKYPPATPEKRTAAHQAVRILAGYCDGARAKDGMGFNKIDAHTGKKLAALDELTDGQVWLATQFARRYQRQLPSDLKSTLGIGITEI